MIKSFYISDSLSFYYLLQLEIMSYCSITSENKSYCYSLKSLITIVNAWNYLNPPKNRIIIDKTDFSLVEAQYVQQTTDPTCRANRITNRNIIFNKEIKLPSKNSRKLLQLLIRRDIYYRKVNHVPNTNEEEESSSPY